MYRIILTIINPQTGDSKVIEKQFDPALMSQAKWTAAYPAVKVEIDALVAESTPKEKDTW